MSGNQTGMILTFRGTGKRSRLHTHWKSLKGKKLLKKKESSWYLKLCRLLYNNLYFQIILECKVKIKLKRACYKHFYFNKHQMELNILTSWSLTDLSNQTCDSGFSFSFSSYLVALNTWSAEEHVCSICCSL